MWLTGKLFGDGVGNSFALALQWPLWLGSAFDETPGLLSRSGDYWEALWLASMRVAFPQPLLVLLTI